jgi:hypothetical protein
MRLFTATTIAALAAASVALAGGSHLISKSSIGRGKLGQSRSAYRAAYGKPKSHDALQGGLVRFNYPERVAVYLKTGNFMTGKISDSGRYIVATSKTFKTTKGVGPCSTAAAVKSAYPSAVKVSLAGGEYAYRLGAKLWFEIESGKVAAVALGATKQAAWIASNTVACGS